MKKGTLGSVSEQPAMPKTVRKLPIIIHLYNSIEALKYWQRHVPYYGSQLVPYQISL